MRETRGINKGKKINEIKFFLPGKMQMRMEALDIVASPRKIFAENVICIAGWRWELSFLLHILSTSFSTLETTGSMFTSALHNPLKQEQKRSGGLWSNIDSPVISLAISTRRVVVLSEKLCAQKCGPFLLSYFLFRFFFVLNSN